MIFFSNSRTGHEPTYTFFLLGCILCIPVTSGTSGEGLLLLLGLYLLLLLFFFFGGGEYCRGHSKGGLTVERDFDRSIITYTVFRGGSKVSGGITWQRDMICSCVWVHSDKWRYVTCLSWWYGVSGQQPLPLLRAAGWERDTRVK